MGFDKEVEFLLLESIDNVFRKEMWLKIEEGYVYKSGVGLKSFSKSSDYSYGFVERMKVGRGGLRV